MFVVREEETRAKLHCPFRMRRTSIRDLPGSSPRQLTVRRISSLGARVPRGGYGDVRDR